MELAEEVDLTVYTPACLPRYREDFVGKTALALGMYIINQTFHLSWPFDWFSQTGPLVFWYLRSYFCPIFFLPNTDTGRFLKSVLKSVFICSGWGLTENGKLPKYLRSVNLKVTRFVRPTGFLETLGGEEGYGACKVIKRQSGTLKVEDSDGGSWCSHKDITQGAWGTPSGAYLALLLPA